MENISELTIPALKKLEKTARKALDDPEKMAKIFSDIDLKSKHLDQITKETPEFNLAIDLLKDYYKGDYNDVYEESLISIVSTIIYINNPLDMVPDYLPSTGLSDDILAAKLCLNEIKDDLNDYLKNKSIK